MQTFSAHTDEDEYPSDQSSPDSLYSDNSPTLPQQTFEFDEFEERDYLEEDAEGAEDGEHRMPTWGNWPEYGVANRAWATRSSASLHGSILSISPRGSIAAHERRKSSVGSAVGARKSSLSRSLLDPRRESELSRFDSIDNSRRSSAKSLVSLVDRRRSSAGTNISLDPLDYGRLRHIASMNVLSRRFSEAIEIASPACTDDLDQPAITRRSISEWSPYTVSSVDDESEIHTAPFVPTPPAPRLIPTVLSNFPLASVAREPTDPLDIASTTSSPTFPSRERPLMPTATPSARALATPPPPAEPSQLLRSRSRPSLKRTMTEYQFPPKGTNGVPLGAAAPRPGLARAASVPFFSATAVPQTISPSRDDAPFKVGSLPIQRPNVLGSSPLRESVRRSSVASFNASRRPSLTTPSGPYSPSRPPVAARRTSASAGGQDDLRRYSFDQRMSLDNRSSLSLATSALRKDSDAMRRRMSEQRNHAPAADRRTSRESSRAASRRSSTSIPMVRSYTSDSRVSTTSRKSSTMSIGEYGYLVGQFDVQDASTEQVDPVHEAAQDEVKPRTRSRPAGIVLPSYSFPTLSPVPGSASLTPRYSPLDSFFGRAPYESTDSVDPLTPLAEITSPVLAIEDPLRSPKSVLNRARPISPSEYTDEGYLQRWKSTSTKSVSRLPTVPSPTSPKDTAIAPTITADVPADVAQKAVIPPPTAAVESTEATPLIPQNVADATRSPTSLWTGLRTPRHPPGAETLGSPPMRITTPPGIKPDEDVSPTSSPLVEQIADLQTISAALATAPIAPEATQLAEVQHQMGFRPSRKAVPVLSEAQLVKENHIERELRSKSSMDQMRQAHRLSEQTGMKRKDADGRSNHTERAISPQAKRLAQFVELANRSPRSPPTSMPLHAQSSQPSRPANRRHMTTPATPYSANPQVSGGPLYTSGNAYAGNALPRRSHVVFELPTWRAPALLDSSPEILASSSLRDGQSYILPNTPRSADPRMQSTIRPGHSRAKSSTSVSVLSARSQPGTASVMSPGGPSSAASTPAMGSAVRPGMGRATSFTKFFSKAKIGSSSSHASTGQGKATPRPTSMDGLAISGLKYRI